MDNVKNIIPLARKAVAAARSNRIVDSLPPGGMRRVPARKVSPGVSDTCSICHGDGFLRVDVPFGHPHFGKLVECKCHMAQRKAQEQRHLATLSRIDTLPHYEDASFETFNSRLPGVRAAYKRARDFADCPEGWLVMTGPFGCGKTFLAVSIARQRLEEGDTVLFQTVPDLLDHLRSSFKPSSEQSFDERFHQMQEADLLILDDYGAQSDTSWANEKIFQLLNYRYNMNLPTVITSNNIHLQGIDPRVYSRLHDKMLVCLVKMEEARDFRIHGDDQDDEE